MSEGVTTTTWPTTLPQGGVVAATDFSPGAQAAVHRAARLAQGLGTHLTVLHVLQHDWITELTTWLGGAQPRERIVADARATLEELVHAMRAQSPALAVHAALVEGHPVRDIDGVARQCQPYCVVLGASGRGGAQLPVLGTTVERLLRKAGQPVLVVRQPPQRSYQRVLVAVDFSPWSAPTLDLAAAVAPQANIWLLHAYTVPYEEKLRFAGVDDEMIELYRQRARERARNGLHHLAQQRGWPPTRYQTVLHEGDAAPALVYEAVQRDCDLVVIGKHGVSAAEELLLGSVTKHALAQVPCDVLVSTLQASA
ncbi:MAG: universal stress protein [Tepidimonas ignava]|uniref:Nucleotide-binding universal stress UspA family protein n=1 Tax=Tepidimonas ignava TaxID=114249 RepID=A0A4R3LE62_9BURK|nr:universal stress protein [Tepidimonas ignava]MCX7815155.1 universal stress protein [Tepidimonas ignava]TCS97675.1 nucleotide-binding universal stress UspA family protein [Tepidimonas ignava]TSE24050.1 Universal stress protein [Tepidimonas ignava]